MKSKSQVIAHWKRNRRDAFGRGHFREVDRINKILKLHGVFPEERKHKWY